MKRLISLIMVLLLAGTAAAEPKTEPPVPANPHLEENYIITEFSEDQNDVFYITLDECNSEAEIIEKYGSLTAVSEFIVDGEIDRVERATMIPSPYGRMLIMSVQYNSLDIDIYCAGGVSAVSTNGIWSMADAGFSAENVDHMWENYIFPFCPFVSFLGMRELDNGMLHMLAVSSEGKLYEYVTTGLNGAMEIVEIRRYSPDENDDYIYDLRVSFEFGKGSIPDKALEMLGEELPIIAEKVIATGNVNLREGPGLGYATLGSMSKGEQAEYLDVSHLDERGQIWYNVVCEAGEGWISGKYAQLR